MKARRRHALFAAYSLIIPALLLPPLVLGWPAALPLAVSASAFAIVWLLSALIVLAAWPAATEDSDEDEADVRSAAADDLAAHRPDAARHQIPRAELRAVPA